MPRSLSEVSLGKLCLHLSLHNWKKPSRVLAPSSVLARPGALAPRKKKPPSVPQSLKATCWRQDIVILHAQDVRHTHDAKPVACGTPEEIFGV